MDYNLSDTTGNINAWNIAYFHNNPVGTPIQTTDRLGNVSWTDQLDPYGNVLPINPSITQNLRFPGQYYDAETGLHYNGQRYYDQLSGRYWQSDRIGLAGGINTYTYVGNNPLRYIDPLGLSGQSAPTYYVPGLPYAYGSPENYALSKALTQAINNASDFVNNALDNIYSANSHPPGFWPGDKGAAEWGKRNDVGAREGKGRFHGIKQSCPGSKATDDYGVNPSNGDVVDPAGDIVGNLNDVKSK